MLKIAFGSNNFDSCFFFKPPTNPATCVPLARLLQTDRWWWWWCTIVRPPEEEEGVLLVALTQPCFGESRVYWAWDQIPNASSTALELTYWVFWNCHICFTSVHPLEGSPTFLLISTMYTLCITQHRWNSDNSAQNQYVLVLIYISKVVVVVYHCAPHGKEGGGGLRPLHWSWSAK